MLISIVMEYDHSADVICSCGFTQPARNGQDAVQRLIQDHRNECPRRVQGAELRRLTDEEFQRIGLRPRRWFTDEEQM